MQDMSNALLTAALTIAGGVIVFTAGQMMNKFFLEPAQEVRRIIVRISFHLSFYAPVYFGYAGFVPPGSIPTEEQRREALETIEALRKDACDLRGAREAFFCYRLAGLLGLVPRGKNVTLATKELIGLSNTVGRLDGPIEAQFPGLTKDARVKRVCEALGIFNPLE